MRARLAVDMPVGLVSRWDEPGKHAICIEGWATLNAITRQAAEAHDVTMVSLFDLFDGTHHDEDPYAKGWILEDHVHPTEAGTAAIANALAAAGFKPTAHP